jgi:hypothetical protein
MQTGSFTERNLKGNYLQIVALLLGRVPELAQMAIAAFIGNQAAGQPEPTALLATARSSLARPDHPGLRAAFRIAVGVTTQHPQFAAQNHNPRVGGSSPSSGIEFVLQIS